MTRPFLVTLAHQQGDGWRALGGAWITRNVYKEAALTAVLVAHLKPDGEDCPGSGGSLGAHTLVSRKPLTLTPSLACNHCAWHGYITKGKWVPV